MEAKSDKSQRGSCWLRSEKQQGFVTHFDNLAAISFGVLLDAAATAVCSRVGGDERLQPGILSERLHCEGLTVAYEERQVYDTYCMRRFTQKGWKRALAAAMVGIKCRELVVLYARRRRKKLSRRDLPRNKQHGLKCVWGHVLVEERGTERDRQGNGSI